MDAFLATVYSARGEWICRLIPNSLGFRVQALGFMVAGLFQAIQDYCMTAPEGLDFLSAPVEMKYGDKASQLPEQPINTVADVMHHILASHAKVQENMLRCSFSISFWLFNCYRMMVYLLVPLNRRCAGLRFTVWGVRVQVSSGVCVYTAGDFLQGVECWPPIG